MDSETVVARINKLKTNIKSVTNIAKAMVAIGLLMSALVGDVNLWSGLLGLGIGIWVSYQNFSEVFNE